jgi:hypothetical protein
MKTFWKVVLSLVGLALIFFIAFEVGLKHQPPVIDPNKAIQSRVDSLQKVVAIEKQFSSDLTIKYYNEIDSTKTAFNIAIAKLRAQYNQNITYVETLGIDSAIMFYKKFIAADGFCPQKMVMDNDTTIQISPIQLNETNQKFASLEYLYILKDTLSSQINALYDLIDSSKVVIKSKDMVISTQDSMISNYSIIVGNDKAEIKQIQKKNLWQNIKWGVIGGAIGIIVGRLL